MLVLARRGLTMLDAKRAIEALLERCVTVVHLPTVEDPATFTADLAQVGIAAVQTAPAHQPGAPALVG